MQVCGLAYQHADIDAETCQDLVGQHFGALKKAIKYVQEQL